MARVAAIGADVDVRSNSVQRRGAMHSNLNKARCKVSNTRGDLGGSRILLDDLLIKWMQLCGCKAIVDTYQLTETDFTFLLTLGQ